MSPGSPPIHDLERAHNALVRDSGFESEGARDRRQRPGLPGADRGGKRPVLLAQALQVALHGDVAAEHPGARQMGADRKGGAPLPNRRQDLPQIELGAIPHFI